MNLSAYNQFGSMICCMQKSSVMDVMAEQFIYDVTEQDTTAVVSCSVTAMQLMTGQKRLLRREIIEK
jgi:hypothetical protein